MQDRYARGASQVTTAPVSTVFAYKCECGLAFTFEIPHGQKPKSRETEMSEGDGRPSGYQVDGDAS
jgi:hypothetical protein